MFSEYLENYKFYTSKYGNKVAIFLMVGMFYEMYDLRNSDGETSTSFMEITDLLGLKVVVKKEGTMDALTAGIPESAVHKWAARLTGLGWTVVLIDQVMNPAGKVTKRAVQRILTPGTHVEAIATADMYITFVSLKGNHDAPHIALTALDLTTGHLHVFETQAQGSKDAWTSNEILQFMELYPPREVLWSIDGLTIHEAKLKTLLGCCSSTTFHQRAPLNSGAWLSSSFREEFLRTKCGLKSLLPTHVALHVGPGSHVETALLSLLYALEELWPSMKLGSVLVFPWVAGSSLRLGENALVQLHMITEDSKQDVLSLFDKCASPMGHRGLRSRLLKPAADPAHILGGLDAVEFWMTKYTKTPDVIGMTSKRLKSMSDVHRLYRKIQQGTVNASDIIGIDTTLKAIQWVMESVGLNDTNLLRDLQDVRSAIFKVFSAEKCYGDSEDTSVFVSCLVPALDALESQIQTRHDSIREWIANCSKAGISPDVLKPEFRDKSLVIKGPRAAIQTLKMTNKLPPNTVAVTNKTTSYLESPELDQIFVSLSRLRESLKQQQSVSLVEQGTELAATILIPWMRVADWITQVDVNLTLARVATDLGYVRPDIVVEYTDSSFTIEGLRHPILEAQDRKIPYVQHNVSLGKGANQGWLLYGLNASGKSSLMRATGLAVLLAQGGSYVPATRMTLAPFASLHTRIVNTDNLWMGLSSFAVEMSEMRDIFREAGSKSLVLGDELCSGTETTSATALVAAGLRGLLKRGAKFLFATHLHGLVQIPEISGDGRLKVWHLHVEYDKILDRLIYHRTLREGSGSSLYGLEVAKAMRIPDDILEDAIRFRKQLTGEAELSESVGSAWNSNVIRRKCESCGATESESLEVHHIKERRMADQGRLADGSSVHKAANLVVLCDTCHDSVHGGQLEIGPMIQTSDGPERSIVSSSSDRKSKWSEEQLRTIESVCDRFPNLSVSGLSKYLLNQHDIQISVGSLRKLRS